MADFQELKQKYENIPIELQLQKRWVCFAVRSRNGESIKIPVSPIKEGVTNGALSDDETSWGTFEEALKYCADNGLDGIGYEFKGSGRVGIDLKNKKDENGEPIMSEMEFRAMSNDFVKTLNSYTEWSVSQNGIHIIINGTLPTAINNNPNIELHDTARYFAMTGNIIGKRGVHDRTEQLQSLISKYGVLKTDKKEETEDLESISDDEVLRRAMKSKSAEKFQRLMDGDTSDYPSKAEAKQALCNFLAFFSACDAKQVDRIYRTSKLFDKDWDSESERTIQKAIESSAAVLVKMKKKEEAQPEQPKPQAQPDNLMNLDDKGEPIFRLPKTELRKAYSLDDTGNAQMFYDYYGENFRWDSKNKVFMFWTGKTWIEDVTGIIRKYANNLIEILKAEVKQYKERIDDEEDENARKVMLSIYYAKEKNVKKISNKSGKDAMLDEFKAIKETSVEPNLFDRDPFLLNTDSGVVDLRTGEIQPFNKYLMLSRNTNIKVSYEDPEEWIKCLHTIFERRNKEDTEQIIECFQRCLGYTLTGVIYEQCLFLLHGDGSNGKSTISNVLQDIMGNYFGTIDSEQLMAKKTQSVAIQNSLAELVGVRYLVTSETEEGNRLSEKTVKEITGGDRVNAQRKFGKPFNYRPIFKPWMMTNSLPIIRGKDYGIWRRVFLFSFLKQFRDDEKDKEMPDKLKAEYPKILGWCIKGAVKYLKDKDLMKPQVLKDELVDYKKSLDTVLMFLNSECYDSKTKGTPKNAMFEAYSRWCFVSKLPTMSKPKFQLDMVSKGYEIISIGESKAEIFKGVALRNEDVPTSIDIPKEGKAQSSIFDDDDDGEDF